LAGDVARQIGVDACPMSLFFQTSAALDIGYFKKIINF